MGIADISWIAVLFLLTRLSLGQANVVTVNTSNGPIQGVSDNAVTTFFGVPYAKPLTNATRFDRAVFPESKTSAFQAFEYGSICIQKRTFRTYAYAQSEDCLTLNIFAPDHTIADKNPVMIFLHGGGFQEGTGRNYNATWLSQVGSSIIVTLNYRLNIFGFLNSNGVKPSNIGLWDQHLAIQWIRRNIANFGGDVSNITIFGESAGAWSVAYQTMSPQNNNTLFQRAIQESGGYLVGPLARRDSEVTAVKMAHLMGCTSTTDPEAVICLRQQTTDDIRTKILKNETLLFLPIQDHKEPYFIKENPFKLLADFKNGGAAAVKDKVGNLHSYDMIFGFNSQEGLLGFHTRIFDDNITSLSYDQLLQMTENKILTDESLSPGDRKSIAIEAIKLYNNSAYNPLPPSIASRSLSDKRLRFAVDMYGELSLAWPTVESAILHSAIALDKKSYFYEFDHNRSFSSWFWSEGPPWLRTGADHFDEIPYIFGLVWGHPVGETYDEDEELLSLSLMNYWTSFASSGDPKTQDNPNRGNVVWPEFNGVDRRYLNFSTKLDVIQCYPLGFRAEFWRSNVIGTGTFTTQNNSASACKSFSGFVLVLFAFFFRQL